MANSKISALTSATTPLAGTETLPIVQGGATVKATVANITGAGAYAGSFTSLAYTTTLTGGTGVIAIGTSQICKDASGNVGIGTSSPSSLFMIRGGAATATISSSTNTANIDIINTSQTTRLGAANTNFVITHSGSNRMQIDSSGNTQFLTGAVMPYAPAPAAISAAATLSNANIQGQIISATGTTYTITMPLGTTLDTLASWATTNIGYDFFVINTATGIITMAVNTGVTSLGSLTIAIGDSAHFRIRRTAASTYVLYRLV